MTNKKDFSYFKIKKAANFIEINADLIYIINFFFEKLQEDKEEADIILPISFLAPDINQFFSMLSEK